jgi:hypothetical protein
MLKNFLGFVSVLIGPFLIAIAYTTNFTSSFVGNVVMLAGIVLFFGGIIYLFIKFMRWLVN